ncbi:carbohydrate kinase family protein, partial [Candidatus Calescamantes bacterium]|nr:carbohydrate kinase family protein [Candidatus Calescamantes bacterium]
DDIPENYLDAGFFLICPINYEIDRELIVKLYQKGKRLSMELSGFGGASSEEKENKVQFLRNIAKFFEIVKGGEEDYRHLFGKMDIRFIEKFIEWGAKVSILTRGEKETLVAVKNCSQIKYFRIPSLPAEVVDTTGAGDVWHAGFLFKYVKKCSLEEAGIFASSLSSLFIEKTGGVKKERFPEYSEINSRVREEVKK